MENHIERLQILQLPFTGNYSRTQLMPANLIEYTFTGQRVNSIESINLGNTIGISLNLDDNTEVTFCVSSENPNSLSEYVTTYKYPYYTTVHNINFIDAIIEFVEFEIHGLINTNDNVLGINCQIILRKDNNNYALSTEFQSTDPTALFGVYIGQNNMPYILK